jgi:hypothetical protein
MSRPRRRSLRARLLDVLAETQLPVSTTDLALLVAFDLPHRDVRVYQVMKWCEKKGLVLRFKPWPPTEPRRGQRAIRWALTPAGLAVALPGPGKAVSRG